MHWLMHWLMLWLMHWLKGWPLQSLEAWPMQRLQHAGPTSTLLSFFLLSDFQDLARDFHHFQ